jgi:hypothetical protein
MAPVEVVLLGILEAMAITMAAPVATTVVAAAVDRFSKTQAQVLISKNTMVATAASALSVLSGALVVAIRQMPKASN